MFFAHSEKNLNLEFHLLKFFLNNITSLCIFIELMFIVREYETIFIFVFLISFTVDLKYIATSFNIETHI